MKETVNSHSRGSSIFLTALLFGGIISGGMVASSLLRILHFVQTGSLLLK